MDNRVFAALLVLASAAEAGPALSAQLGAGQVSRTAVVQSVYNVAVSPNAQKVGTEAFAKLGYAPAEAGQMAGLAATIARKAGSYANFAAIVGGRTPAGIMLDPRESAMIRTLSGKLGGGAAGGPTTRSAGAGATWEGTSGRTWEGSAMAASSNGTLVRDAARVREGAAPAKAVGAAPAKGVR
ncbi:MAG: hypothetical protein B7Y97_13135 [Sphingomonas sp. 32-66-10]|nr:MAG: hypothetical protein B7Y97_13135 [Sphingomonas sp. 32-66-10]